MGAALRPLEQENDLKEGLINTSSMIQGARDRMLKCGGEHSTGIIWKWVRRRRREQAGEGGNWCSNFCNTGLKCRLLSIFRLWYTLGDNISWNQTICWSSKIRPHKWQQNVAESKQNCQLLHDFFALPILCSLIMCFCETTKLLRSYLQSYYTTNLKGGTCKIFNYVCMLHIVL